MVNHQTAPAVDSSALRRNHGNYVSTSRKVMLCPPGC